MSRKEARRRKLMEEALFKAFDARPVNLGTDLNFMVQTYGQTLDHVKAGDVGDLLDDVCRRADKAGVPPLELPAPVLWMAIGVALSRQVEGRSEKLTDDDKCKIRETVVEALGLENPLMPVYESLATRFGVSVTTIRNVCKTLF